MWGNLVHAIRRHFRNTRRSGEIEPDQIFLDASNLPAFDRHQFEGRIETPIRKHTLAILGAAFALVVCVFIWRAGELQVAGGDHFAALAANNRLDHATVFAERGVIYDRNGTPLVWNTPNPDGDFALRTYTDTTALAHVLGYVSYPARDSSGAYYQHAFVGRDGIEKAYNTVLSGENGRRIVETDALSEVRSKSVIEAPEDGETLALSIDAPLQQALFDRIKQTALDRGFSGGAGIILDVRTGEVVALASYPAFDPNVLVSGTPSEQIREYVLNPQTPFLNRATTGLYTPGSIVKPFLAAAALAENVIDPETEILSTGTLEIPNPYNPDNPTVFTDWKAHGWVDMREALAVSSNVYFYEIGGGFEEQQGLGIARINEYMERFGFGSQSGINLPGEQSGIIPNPEWKEDHFNGEEWRIGDTYNTAIGQYGFQVTPLQAARATAALANGGTLTRPSLEQGGNTTHTAVGISDEDLHVAREGMRLSVTNGTAAGLNVPFVSVAGKTGTAEVGTRKKLVNSWVIGFFPYESPRYAFTILMEKGPHENTIGGVFVMRQVLEWMQENASEMFTNSD